MAKHGGKREGAGRKSKSDEQALAEKLSKYEDIAFDALEDGLRNKQQWAVTLYFNYQYGKPTEKREISLTDDTIKQFVIKGAKGNTDK